MQKKLIDWSQTKIITPPQNINWLDLTISVIASPPMLNGWPNNWMPVVMVGSGLT